MAKPLDTQTNKELEETLTQGGLSERKAAAAEEILRRRHDAKSETLREKHGWLGALLAACGLVILSLKQLWRKKATQLKATKIDLEALSRSLIYHQTIPSPD